MFPESKASLRKDMKKLALTSMYYVGRLSKSFFLKKKKKEAKFWLMLTTTTKETPPHSTLRMSHGIGRNSKSDHF